MKFSKTFIVTVAILLIVGGRLWYDWNKQAHAPLMVVAQHGDEMRIFMHRQAHPLLITHYPNDPGFRQKANELSLAEMVEMTNLFVTKLKPAVEKWASVYGDRVPFNLADLTMDKFVERLETYSKVYHSYAFVVGDITLGIVEQNGAAEVQYLASSRTLTAMRTLPTMGLAPDLSMTVTREQVLAMAHADGGEQFRQSDCMLTASAESSSLPGGAIVDVGTALKNVFGFQVSEAKTGFSYVFAKDGTLAYYMRN